MGKHQVVAGALVRDGQVLLCHRSPDRVWYPDLWDLPGGHIEGAETEEAALVREIAEEVGVRIEVPASPPLARIQTEGLELAVYLVRLWDGLVTNEDTKEHDRLGWFSQHELRGLQLAHPAYLGLLSELLS